MKRNMVLRYVATGLVAIGVCMATGCATKDTVSSRFPQLEENINAAKAVDAEVYAPAPLKSAETKLAAGQSGRGGGGYGFRATGLSMRPWRTPIMHGPWRLRKRPRGKSQ